MHAALTNSSLGHNKAITDGTSTKKLATGETFGFGDETLILTNAIKEQNMTLGKDGVAALVAQARVYWGERTLKSNSVVAMHSVTVTEDANIGMLTLEAVKEVLHDLMRLGRSGSVQDETVTVETLEKRKVLGAGTFGTVWLTKHTNENPYALKVQYKVRQLKFTLTSTVLSTQKTHMDLVCCVARTN